MSDQSILFCTFCARPQTDVGILVMAPGGSAAICDDCIDIAVDLVRLAKQDLMTAAAAGRLKREENPEWLKGLHEFLEPRTDTKPS